MKWFERWCWIYLGLAAPRLSWPVALVLGALMLWWMLSL